MVGQNLKHYTVEAILGKGGMGTVYRARDTRLQRPVALKVLTPDLIADPDRKQRFLQEARAAAAITHPAIAQVYDVDEADGVTFIVMELVEGQTVRQLITAHDLDLLSALEVAIQVGEGLARAHETGIVHRDIKSENIMVTKDGHAKILDFGLAKLNPLHNVPSNSGAEEHMSQMATVAQTQAGMVVGTLAYMSPEQARGRSVDHRSDIFSLGVTLYEMATGQLPFSGQSPLDTMHAIAFEETRPITSLRQNLPPELHRIISRCLRKRPEDRYPDAKALVDDLKALKKDIDSGVTRAMPMGDRLREQFESFKNLKPATLAWVAGGTIVLLILVLLFFSNKSLGFGPIVGLLVVGLLIYRHYRHRPQRMVKRFAARIGKFPEVKLITCQQKNILVVVDRMQAKIYVRVNSMLESMNKKLFFGDPMTVSVRDDVPQDELRRILQQPGILYVRDDVFP
jgi:predicted Ser/Thr protein kinase